MQAGRTRSAPVDCGRARPAAPAPLPPADAAAPALLPAGDGARDGARDGGCDAGAGSPADSIPGKGAGLGPLASAGAPAGASAPAPDGSPAGPTPAATPEAEPGPFAGAAGDSGADGGPDAAAGSPALPRARSSETVGAAIDSARAATAGFAPDVSACMAERCLTMACQPQCTHTNASMPARARRAPCWLFLSTTAAVCAPQQLPMGVNGRQWASVRLSNLTPRSKPRTRPHDRRRAHRPPGAAPGWPACVGGAPR
jgi:hypothetical protein